MKLYATHMLLFKVGLIYIPPTLDGIGPPASGEYQQGLHPVALTG